MSGDEPPVREDEAQPGDARGLANAIRVTLTLATDDAEAVRMIRELLKVWDPRVWDP